jgi:hypothetical protein
MGGVIGRPQLGRDDVGVALCRRDAGMSQQLLDAPQIRPAQKQMGGESVTKFVR